MQSQRNDVSRHAAVKAEGVQLAGGVGAETELNADCFRDVPRPKTWSHPANFSGTEACVTSRLEVTYL